MARNRNRRRPRRRPKATSSSTLGPRTAASALVIGLAVFLYQIRELLLEHSESVAYYGTPAAWSEIVSAAFWAVVAIGGALGLNVQRLIGDLSSLVGGRHEAEPQS